MIREKNCNWTLETGVVATFVKGMDMSTTTLKQWSSIGYSPILETFLQVMWNL
jgi:hypothetical protein